MKENMPPRKATEIKVHSYKKVLISMKHLISHGKVVDTSLSDKTI